MAASGAGAADDGATDDGASDDGASDDRLEIRGLRVVAVHGVLAEETERAQPFELDLDVWADLTGASRSDDLADTVDYGELVARAAGAAGAPRCALLEAVAARVADAVLGVDARISAVAVTVRKLRPPVPFDLASAGVRVLRRRPDPGPT
jgi:dihydroneopterin aldolase